MHTLPLSHSGRCFAYHACLHHPLAFFASLHACLHVHAWLFIDSVSSILQHNEAMDIRSKPTFVPSGHHLLFVCLFACLFSRSFVHLACPISCHILCLPCVSCLFVLCLFICSLRLFLPLLVCWFSCLCLCMYAHGVRKHGAGRVSWAQAKGVRMWAADMSQAVAVSRFRSLAFPFGHVLF